jgi:hypothetical protein
MGDEARFSVTGTGFLLKYRVFWLAGARPAIYVRAKFPLFAD